MLRLGVAPEPHLNDRWPMFVAVMARFSQPIDEALTLGWTLESLFSLPWSPLGTVLALSGLLPISGRYGSRETELPLAL